MTTTSATTSTTAQGDDGAAAERVASLVVAELERVWAAIIRRHPDVPPVVVTLASGTVGVPAGSITLGHFAGARWEHLERGDLAELFVAGEGLARGPRDVLGTLLHEAAHGVGHTRGIRNTSRQGRYHNTEYKKLGMELGLSVAKADPIGWSDTDVPDSTAAEYADEIARLGAVIRAHRRSEHVALTIGAGAGAGDDGETGGGEDVRASNNNGVAALCGCEPPRRIRVAPSVLTLGAIECKVCGEAFTGPDEQDKAD
ncbi:hypothetical protein ACFYTC_48495 [Actinomadura nitritigenes]|jgi:hypothetical protein|uniref:hypothetical protein n=1 Tax=Actinomadura nitritigenes TaxID=134602 RepID=UPI00367E0285